MAHPEERRFVLQGYRFKGFHPINGCQLIKASTGPVSYIFYINLTEVSEAWNAVVKEAAQKKCRLCHAAFNSDLTQVGTFGDWV